MSASLEHHTLVVAARSTGHDRASVCAFSEGLRVALADGAGGTSGAAGAAELVVAAATGTEAAIEAARLIDQVDAAVAATGGQTTAVVLQVSGAGIRGASVRDSQAWVVRPGDVDELTGGQVRKPLVGAGCRPVAFAAPALGDGVLLVASDGLFSYAPGAEVLRIVRAGGALAAMAKALVELVRLRSGALADDVPVVLVRARPDG